MNDFYISLAISVLLQVLKDTGAIKRTRPALRKVFLNLYALRLEILKPEDFKTLGLQTPEDD